MFFSSLIDTQQHFYIKNTQGTFQEIKVPQVLQQKPIIRTLYIDHNFWFCTNEGVFVAQWKDNTLRIKNHYLPDEACTKVVKDTNNNYWITTLNSGIYVLPNIAIEKLEINKELGLIKDLIPVEKHVIFGTTKGVMGMLNTQNNQLNTFTLPTSDEVSALIYDNQKKLVFISQKNTSFIWNLALATIQKCTSFNASKSLFYEASGVVLNASFDRANSTKNPFQNYKNTEKFQFKKPSFSSQTATFELENHRMKRAYTCFIESSSKDKYVGFVDNLICFDLANKETIISYKQQPIFALDIKQTQDGTIWVATFENGIIGIKNKHAFINLNETNGLLSNQAGKLLIEGNNLWITSNKGIQKYNLTTKQFQNITSIDGFDHYEITDIDIVNKKLYIASNKGIFILNTAQCLKQRKTPTVYFTEFTIQDKPSVLASQYELDYDKNAIKIAFNVNGFMSSQNINYLYKLNGFDNKWTTLESGIDFVRFSSLPPGNYQFEVKAKYNNGNFSESIFIQFKIHKPFWQMWWFYAVLSLLFAGTLWFYFKKRLKRVEKENKFQLEKAQVDKELIFYQLENLRSQMNPHFIFNALNSIQEYIVTNEKANASAYLVKFSKLIRLYLEHSRENEVQLEEEIRALEFYLELEKDRFEDTLNFEIIVDPNLNLKTTMVPSLFIQPYVENAIKHGLLHKKENRKVKVTFHFDEEIKELYCSIQDNGIGRKAAEEINQSRRSLHKSFATSANQKRVDLINKTRNKKISVHIEDLEDKNQVAMGTRVIISIPF